MYDVWKARKLQLPSLAHVEDQRLFAAIPP
jgi:hypothetical protein